MSPSQEGGQESRHVWGLLACVNPRAHIRFQSEAYAAKVIEMRSAL